MNAWSPRLLTKASRAPSGDQTGFEHCPRTWKIGEGAVLPSTEAHQSWPRRTKARRSPLGEIAGELPSAILRGEAPSRPAIQMVSAAPFGSIAGLGISPAPF